MVTEDGEAVAFGIPVATVTPGRSGPTVPSYRYRLPHVDGSGWAVVYLEGDGRFLAQSDYGTYAYRWDAAGPVGTDFRAWFADLAEHEAAAGNTYFLGKVSRQEFDVEAAREWCDKTFREAHPEVGEYDVPSTDEIHHAGDVYQFAKDHELPGDVRHLDEYPGQAYGFRDVVLPRLARLIRAQLAAEKPLPQKQEQKQTGYCDQRHGKAVASRCRKRPGHRGKHRAADRFEW